MVFIVHILTRILIQDKSSKIVHGELVARPHFGHIERIEAQLLRVSFLGLHDLDLSRPFRLFATINGFPKIALGIVGIFAHGADSFVVIKLLLTMFGDEVCVCGVV
jgi:hypothetical protein